MKKLLAIPAVALVLTLSACGASEEELHQQMLDAGKTQAIEACTEAVKDKAKYPAGAELVTPIEGSLQPAEDDQGPFGTVYHSVNFGDATFVNGFNVPVDYKYGCVSYHDEEGNLLKVKAEAREDQLLSSYSYNPSTDKLQ